MQAITATNNDSGYETQKLKSKSTSGLKIITGFHFQVIYYYLWFTVAWIAFKKLKSPLKAIRVIKKIDQLRKDYMGDYKVQKFVLVDHRYFWDMVSPGFPSSAFNQHIENEVYRIYPFRGGKDGLKIVMLAITKKCPLQCEHCYEWEALNKKETLTLQNLKTIVEKFQNKGVAQFELGGGEPLHRFDELIQLLNASDTSESDFWISTSGFGLTKEKATKLKHAGLAGVSISIDHFDADSHNRFRGNPKAFEWALEAIKNARDAHLVVSLSLCATKEFINEENLWQYLDFARDLGVPFIQIIEPRAVGHYSGKDVELSAAHNTILERFMLEVNYNTAHRHLPLVTYHGHYQRKGGCYGAGNRYLYIDTDGDMHACPFCGKKSGSALASNYQSSIEKMKEAGCDKFEVVAN